MQTLDFLGIVKVLRYPFHVIGLSPGCPQACPKPPPCLYECISYGNILRYRQSTRIKSISIRTVPMRGNSQGDPGLFPREYMMYHALHPRCLNLVADCRLWCTSRTSGLSASDINPLRALSTRSVISCMDINITVPGFIPRICTSKLWISPAAKSHYQLIKRICLMLSLYFLVRLDHINNVLPDNTPIICKD